MLISKRIILLWMLALFFVSTLSAQYTKNDIYIYLDTYKELAIKKMHEYKIPASITLAQGIFESACGTSRLAKYGNNHFGIKCHNEWEGDTLLVDDDALGECFRKYESVEDSYTDHSLFLTTRPRYCGLFDLNVMDYKAWAHGLKEAGYATNPKYAERIISVIETYRIAQYDTIYYKQAHQQGVTIVENKEQPVVKEKPVVKENPVVEVVQEDKSKKNQKEKKKQLIVEKETKNEVVVEPTFETNGNRIFFSAQKNQYPKGSFPFTTRDVYVNNKTYFVIAEKEDTYAKIAEDVQDLEKNIRKYNDMGQYSEPMQGEVIYIENKAKQNTTHPTHTIQKGETLRFIAQKYGIQLSSLLRYNNFTENTVIYPNCVVKLKP